MLSLIGIGVAVAVLAALVGPELIDYLLDTIDLPL
jgi:hypothetical protein